MRLIVPACWLLLFPVLAMAEPLPPSAKNKPETFDWIKYVDDAGSTADQMFRAEEGVKLLQQRMDEILAAYRKLLESRRDKDELRLLEEMQAAWQKAEDAEVSFIGSAWIGGTGAKAAFPRARMECHLRHVKDLIGMKARCMALNE